MSSMRNPPCHHSAGLVDLSILENKSHIPDSMELTKLYVRIFNEEARKGDNPEEAAKAQDAEWIPRGLRQAYLDQEKNAKNSIAVCTLLWIYLLLELLKQFYSSRREQ